LLGSHVINAEELVMFDALTQDGPNGASRPIIIVQAASLEVFLFSRTDLTLMRWAFFKKIIISKDNVYLN